MAIVFEPWRWRENVRKPGAFASRQHPALLIMAGSNEHSATGILPPMQPEDVIALRFEIERRVGSGGMGEVYLARDRSSGEAVAVKVLLDRSPSGAARFLREAEVLSRLRHPGIVRHVAHGEAAAGTIPPGARRSSRPCPRTAALSRSRGSGLERLLHSGYHSPLRQDR
jgi:serine/threonine protein kinase